MELLIPGLALVALMVYLSTRIKRTAARAFDAEQIEGDGFRLAKPEGFLHRIDERSEFAFDAYSKDFGIGSAENVRVATAVVVVRDGSLKEAEDAERSRLASVGEAENFELGGSHCRILSGELVRVGHTFAVSTKIFQADQQTITLRIEVLKEQTADFAGRIDVMMVSFELI